MVFSTHRPRDDTRATPLDPSRARKRKVTTVKTKSAPAPTGADLAAAQAAEDRSLFATLDREAASFVQGTTALLSVLVRILDTDAWTRHQEEGHPETGFATFRAFTKAYLTARGIQDSLAATLASQAEGAYHVQALQGNGLEWRTLTQSVLANIGRATDPTAAASAVAEVASKTPKGKKLGNDCWASALKIDPTACATRAARVSSKSHAVKLAERAMALTNNDRNAARNVLRSAIAHLDAEEKKKGE